MNLHHCLLAFLFAPAAIHAVDLVPLFDGKTLNGWRTYGGKPAGGWEVVDGTLHAIAKVKGAELITEKKYRDFEFSWEWKLPPAGNNGVKYFVTEARTKSPGHEYQMLDDAGHPDGKIGPHRQTVGVPVAHQRLPGPRLGPAAALTQRLDQLGQLRRGRHVTDEHPARDQGPVDHVEGLQ